MDEIVQPINWEYDMAEYIKSIKIEFMWATWLDLYEASKQYYSSTLFKVENDKELSIFLRDCEDETLDCIKELKDIINKKNSKDNVRARVIKEAREYSVIRCNPDSRAKREMITAQSEEMFPKDILIENLAEAWIIAFNPLLYYDWIWWKAKCIFKPSRRLCTRHPWLIDKVYYGQSNIYKYALVNLDKLHSYTNIIVTKEDIEDIHYSLYHPILWSWIANKDFSKFKLQ